MLLGLVVIGIGGLVALVYGALWLYVQYEKAQLEKSRAHDRLLRRVRGRAGRGD